MPSDKDSSRRFGPLSPEQKKRLLAEFRKVKPYLQFVSQQPVKKPQQKNP